MFSLIITVISIALVAALALATLYYGGAAFSQGASRAEASKLVLQGQQLLGAADLYFTEHREWPNSIDQLVSGGYLKQIPSAQASGLNEALAAGSQWQMVTGQPTFYTPTAAADVCAEVNLSASLKKRGVLKQAYSSLVAQCYGDGSLTTVFRKDANSTFPTPGDVVAGDPPADPTDPAWYVQPGATPPASGGGGSGPTYPPQSAYSCTPFSSAVIQGDTVDVQIAGTNAGSLFAWDGTPTVKAGSTVLGLDWADGWSSDLADAGVMTGSLPVGSYTLQFISSSDSSVTASCSLDIVSSHASGPASPLSVNVTPTTGPAGTTVTLQAVDGEFAQNSGHKPDVVLFNTDNSQQYRVPESMVTYVDSTHLRLAMPPAKYLGLSRNGWNQAGFLVSNYNTSDTAVGNQYFAYTFPPAVGGKLTVTPTAMDFGSRMQGETATQTITVKNTGTGATDYSLDWGEGIGGGNWQVDQKTCWTSQTLEPGDSCQIDVTFQASSPGTSSLDVPITDVNKNTVITVHASGTVEPYPLKFFYNGIAFQGYNFTGPNMKYAANTDLNQTPNITVPLYRVGGSRVIQFELRNSSATRSVSLASIGGEPGDTYTFNTTAPTPTVQSTTCGSSLAAGASCTIDYVLDIVFYPGCNASTCKPGYSQFRPKVEDTNGVTTLALMGVNPQRDSTTVPSSGQKVDWIGNAGVNLFEVPVDSPYTSDCAVGKSGNAGAVNSCVQDAAMATGQYSSCARFNIEPQPGNTGTYQSRVSCTLK